MPPTLSPTLSGVIEAEGRYLDVPVTDGIRGGKKHSGTVTAVPSPCARGRGWSVRSTRFYGRATGEVVPEYPAVPIATNVRPNPDGLPVPMSITIV